MGMDTTGKLATRRRERGGRGCRAGSEGATGVGRVAEVMSCRNGSFPEERSQLARPAEPLPPVPSPPLPVQQRSQSPPVPPPLLPRSLSPTPLPPPLSSPPSLPPLSLLLLLIGLAPLSPPFAPLPLGEHEGTPIRLISRALARAIHPDAPPSGSRAPNCWCTQGYLRRLGRH